MFLERQKVCDLLRMSVRASYRQWNRMRPRHHMVSSTDVVDMLNRSARAGQRRISDIGVIPQTMTASDVEEKTGYPARRLVLATRDTRHPLPHWKINSRVIRFDLASVQAWLDED